jgi:hypothetical protein
MRARERAGIPQTSFWMAREVNVAANTTEIGDELRDHVIDLLLARGVIRPTLAHEPTTYRIGF